MSACELDELLALFSDDDAEEQEDIDVNPGGQNTHDDDSPTSTDARASSSTQKSTNPSARAPNQYFSDTASHPSQPSASETHDNDHNGSHTTPNTGNTSHNPHNSNNSSNNSNSSRAAGTARSARFGRDRSKSDANESIACKGSSIRVDPSSRVISRESLDLRLRNFKLISLANLSNLLSSSRANGTLSKKSKDLHFVMLGVMCRKLSKQSEKGNKYLILTLTDLNTFEISLFAFDKDVISACNKLSIGAVVAVANPRIMQPRKGGAANNTTGASSNKFNNYSNFSNYSNKSYNKTKTSATYGKNDNFKESVALSMNDVNQILYVGQSLDLSFCPKMKQFGTGTVRCNKIINKQVGAYCSFHSKQEYLRLMSKRNEINRSQMKKFDSRERIRSVTHKNSQFSVSTGSRFKKAKNYANSSNSSSSSSSSSNSSNSGNRRYVQKSGKNGDETETDIVCVESEKEAIVGRYQHLKRTDSKRAEYFRAKHYNTLNTNKHAAGSAKSAKDAQEASSQMIENAIEMSKNKLGKRSLRMLKASQAKQKSPAPNLTPQKTKSESNQNKNKNTLLQQKEKSSLGSKKKTSVSGTDANECDVDLSASLSFVPQLGRGLVPSARERNNGSNANSARRFVTLTPGCKGNGKQPAGPAGGGRKKRSYSAAFEVGNNSNLSAAATEMVADAGESASEMLAKCSNEAQKRAFLKLGCKKIDAPPDPNATFANTGPHTKEKCKNAVLADVSNTLDANGRQQKKRRLRRSLVIGNNSKENGNGNENENEDDVMIDLSSGVKSNEQRRRRLSMSDARKKELMEATSINSGYLKRKQIEKIDAEAQIFEEQEKIGEQLEQVNSVRVRLFTCQKMNCKMYLKPFEARHFLCDKHPKFVKLTVGTKYFWKCSNCQRKETTINRKRHLGKCMQCGQASFVSASAYNVPQMKSKDKKLKITSSRSELRSMFG